MNSRVEKVFRFVSAGVNEPRAVHYWRARPFEERLRETLALHREGNELFKGGNPAFVHVLEIRHVRTAG